MRNYLIVGCGGALGAIARYWVGNLFKIGEGGFPMGTFIINVSGSFILGLFLTLISEKYVVPVEWRLFFATGFTGAYTTFSSFTNEVVALLRQGYWVPGVLYSAASLLSGMLFVGLGVVTARKIAFGRFFRTERELEAQLEREEASLEQAELTGSGKTGSLPTEERNELDQD
jgi:fluoride exporter